MNLSQTKRLLVAALIAAMAAPANAGNLWDAMSSWEQPNMHIDVLELHPYAKFTESYDSNIFLAPRSNVLGNNANNNTASPVLGSWIHDTNAGLKVNLPVSENLKFDAAYDFVWRDYSKDPRINNTINEAAAGSFNYKGPAGVSVKGEDVYLNTTDPASTELTQRSKRWQNKAGGEIAYAPERGNIWVSGDGSDTRYKYIADNPALRATLDRYDAFMGGRLGWRLQPKTLLFAGYHRELQHYSVHQNTPEQPANPKDSKSHLFEAGIEGDIAPKLSGKLSSGAIYRRYDSVAAGQSQNKRLRRDWIYFGMLTYKPLERTTAILTGARGLQEATFQGDQYYLSSNVGLAVVHKLPYKVTLSVNGSVEWDKYQNADKFGGITSNRRDDLYIAGSKVGYEIQKWLKTELSYTYTARFSRFSEQFDYRDHLTSLSLGVFF